jgi:hypothetical protein
VYDVRMVQRPAGWVVERCRVIAPSECNFHPDGGLARALRSPSVAAALEAPGVGPAPEAPSSGAALPWRSVQAVPMSSRGAAAPPSTSLRVDSRRAAVSALDPGVEFSLPTAYAGVAHA